MLEMLKELPRPVQTALAAVTLVAVLGIVGSVVFYNDHQDALAAWDQEKAELTKQIDVLATESDSLKAQVDQQTAKIGELEAANTGLTRIHGSIAALETEAAASKGKLAGLSHEIAQSESRLKMVGHRLATNQTSLMRAVKRRQATIEDVKEMKVNRTRLTRLRHDLHAEERKLQLVGMRMATEQIGLQKALKRRRHAIEQAEEVQVRRGALAELVTAIESSERRVKSLARRLAASQVSLEGAIKRQRKADEANRELKVQNDWLAQVVTETGAKERQLKVVSQRLAASQASFARTLQQRQQVIEDTQARRAQLVGVERKLVPLQRQIAAWQDEVEQLKGLVEDARTELGGALIN